MPTTEQAQGVGWEDPPERPTRYDWSAIANKLKRRPEKWYKVFDRDRASLVVALRQGGIKAMHPDKGFEFRTSNNERNSVPRMCTLHARYVPDNDKE